MCGNGFITDILIKRIIISVSMFLVALIFFLGHLGILFHHIIESILFSILIMVTGIALCLVK